LLDLRPDVVRVVAEPRAGGYHAEMSIRAWIVLVVLAMANVWSCPAARADQIDDQLATIARTGPQGAGSPAARAALDALSGRGPEILPRLLAAMDSDNPVAANWYRSAYDAIVDRELAKSAPDFPRKQLQDVVGDRDRGGRVRRLALLLCERVEPGYRDKVVRRLLDDPEFRDDAVDMALAAGAGALASGDSEAAREEFQKAFEHARDANQVSSAAASLAKLGEQVDIAGHLGLVVDWWVVGPFDAPRFTGFAREFPPEVEVDLERTYTGQDAAAIGWRRHHTNDPLGMVDLVQALAPAKEAVGYAYAEIDSPRAQAAQLRAGADDNLTVWLNGQKVFSREQWLNGSRFDRFTAPVRLVRGKNIVLVKICQGPQHVNPDVPNNWTFQLRFCDPQGGGVPFTSALAAPSGAAK
jgi:hypothetical protein